MSKNLSRMQKFFFFLQKATPIRTYSTILKGCINTTLEWQDVTSNRILNSWRWGKVLHLISGIREKVSTTQSEKGNPCNKCWFFVSSQRRLSHRHGHPTPNHVPIEQMTRCEIDVKVYEISNDWEKGANREPFKVALTRVLCVYKGFFLAYIVQNQLSWC